MKAVVLAAGKGTRLLPITEIVPKPLVPVANQPVLLYGLRHIVAAGISEVAVVVSPDNKDQISAAVLAAGISGLEPTFIEQASPDGLAAALALALPWVDGEDCLMYLADNIFEGGVAELVGEFERSRPNCLVMLHEVADPQHFGVADLGDNGSIRRLVEKPADPPSNLAVVGAYVFDGTIGGAIDGLEPSARGELEITDAIQQLVIEGREVRATIDRGWWKDAGTLEDLLEANSYLLRQLAADQEGDVENSAVEGTFALGSGSLVSGSEVSGPVIVGEACHVADSRLGPHSAIGEHCRLRRVDLSRCIVMDDVEIDGWRLHDSLIGPGTRLLGEPPPEPVSGVIGRWESAE